MAWKIYDEALEMVEMRFRYFPHVFRWRGRHLHVDTVERCWTVCRRTLKRSIQRHFFQVCCAEGVFELYQDVEANTWHLRRARLAPDRVAVARRVAPAWR